jgi:hypothetical protein
MRMRSVQLRCRIIDRRPHRPSSITRHSAKSDLLRSLVVNVTQPAVGLVATGLMCRNEVSLFAKRRHRLAYSMSSSWLHGARARIDCVVQSKRGGDAAETLLERNGRSKPLDVDFTIEMEIGKLAVDRLHHRAAWDTEITRAEIGPFRAVLGGIAVAPTSSRKNAADKVGLALEQIVICDHNRPLHARSKIAAVDP